MKTMKIMLVFVLAAATLLACVGCRTQVPAPEAQPTETQAAPTEEPTAPVNLTENGVTLVNARGDFMTVYPQEDGTWLDADSIVYTFNGEDAWIDEGGAEWNLPAEEVPTEPANLTENPLKLVNAKGDFVTVYPQADGTWLDADSNVYTFDGAEDWTTAEGQVWNRALETLVLVNPKGDYLGVSNDGGTYTDAKGNALTFDGVDTWRDKDGFEWNQAALVELVNLKGDNTNVFLQEDGTYADAEGSTFYFDGADTWMDTAGAEWAFTVN